MLRFFVFLFSLFALPGALAQPQRLALVIGNDNYSAVSPLVNARADANAIAQALTRSGFKVTLRTNVDLNGFKQALRTFKAELRGGDEAIFFFAGHGVELSGANFLLPIDIKGDTEDQVRDDAVPLQRVLEDMQERKTGFALAIIDACRNNPFRERGRAIGGRGLAATNAATGQMVLYSAGTGQRALDQLGPRDPVKNGVFTRVLLREMQKPGVPVADVLRNVREVVAQLAKSVGEEQLPAIYDQSLGRFYFTQPVVAERIPDLSPAQLEERFWDDTKAAGNREAFEAYRKEYPTGRYANLARANIVRLTTPVATAPPPVVVAPPQPAPAASAPPQPTALRSGSTFRDCPECPEMVVIPAGRFLMGSTTGDSHERPVRTVSIQDFSIGKFEVTQREWQAIMGSNPSYFKGDTLPVDNVSWNDAQTFVERLSARTGKRYRLPSEAEWEYAARAGSTGDYSFGSDPSQLGQHAWFSGNSGAQTHPVGQKLANAFGLHAVHGNVWEWVQDCWNASYAGAPTDGSAWARGDCSRRLLRGGSWYGYPEGARAASRSMVVATFRNIVIGFRVARTD